MGFLPRHKHPRKQHLERDKEMGACRENPLLPIRIRRSYAPCMQSKIFKLID